MSDAAKEAGGEDNITAVAMSIGVDPETTLVAHAQSANYYQAVNPAQGPHFAGQFHHAGGVNHFTFRLLTMRRSSAIQPGESAILASAASVGRWFGQVNRLKTSVHKSSRTRTQSRRLRMETLEARRVLATYIVDTNEDTAFGICEIDGVGNFECSLRSAIIAANNNDEVDVIMIPAGTYNLTIANDIANDATEGSLDILDSVAIVGMTGVPGDVIINANGLDSVFTVEGTDMSPIDVRFESLTIQGGLTDEEGGGIQSRSFANLEVINSILQNNGVIDPSFAFGGGAIYSTDSLLIEGSVIRNNLVSIDGLIATGIGGGVLHIPEAGSSLVIRDTRFEGNSAGDGGGFFVSGSDPGMTAILENVVFDQNRASGDGGSDGGGAFFGGIDSITITGGAFTSNIAGRSGGGINIETNFLTLADVSVNITGTSFRDNQADLTDIDSSNGGGAISAFDNVNLEIRNSQFLRNMVGPMRGSGGAIQAVASLLIEDSEIRENQVSGNGGGVSFFGSATDSLTILRTIFANNTASEAGGGLDAFGDFASPVIVDDVTFDQNIAGLSGGGAYLYLVGSVDIVDSRFQGNTTDEAGGGLYLLDTGPALISQSVFDGNTANGGGGGGIAILTDATIEDSLFQNNIVTSEAFTFDKGGGGISIAQDFDFEPTVEILRSSILDNRAPLGGGIGSANANLTVIDSTIARNNATNFFGGGGGIGFAQDDTSGIVPRVTLSIVGSVIEGNLSAVDAAGIGIADADASIVRSTVSSNVAGGRGGGIGIIGSNNSPTLSIEESTVAFNIAGADGGGIAVVNAGIEASNLTISNNSSDGFGGGLAYSNTNDSLSSIIAFTTIASNSTLSGLGSNIASDELPFDIASSLIADPIGINEPGTNFLAGLGSINSIFFNIDSDGSGNFTSLGDQSNVDPRIGPLADNGGPVQTRALLPGSPAIDGSGTSPLPTDARGFPRLQDGNADGEGRNDIGSFEAPELTLVANDDLASVDRGESVIISVLDNDDTNTPPLRIVSVSQPANGTASIVGDEILYIAVDSFIGDDVFTYTITNSPIGVDTPSRTAVVTVAVSGPSLPPRDFGDAPDSYMTLQASGGPSHVIIPGLSLGQLVDSELDGQPSPLADGDDLNGPIGPGGVVLDDEDGIRLLSPIASGFLSTFEVNITNTTGEVGFLQAWFDFNKDGVFGFGEQVLSNAVLQAGTNSVNIAIPFGVTNGDLFTRWRYSLTPDLGIGGPANSGEVEDHLFVVSNFSPEIDLATSTLSSQPEVAVDDLLTYTIFVDNLSLTTATNVTVVTSVGNLAFINDAFASVGTVLIEPASNLAIWTIPSIPALTTFSYTLEVFADFPGLLLTTSEASSPATDPDLTNNLSSNETIIVSSLPDVLHTLTTGNGDGDIRIDVDAFGRFGSGGSSPVGMASFDPVGPLPSAEVVFESKVGFRLEGGLGFEELSSSNLGATITQQVDGNISNASSAFIIGELSVTLDQTVTPTVHSDGSRAGAQLRQGYAISNNSGGPVSFDLARYMDASLEFESSFSSSGGGILVDSNGRLIAFLTDSGGTASSNTPFVAITATGGDFLANDRFDIDQFSLLENRLFNTLFAAPLRDAVSGDINADGFVDAGQEYDSAAALRNVFTLAPGQSVVYVTETIFGIRPDSLVPPVASGDLIGRVFCDINGNGIEDLGEATAGALVFVDLNGNRIFDSVLGEPHTFTDAQGNYSMFVENLPPGQRANVVVVNPPGCFPSAPEIGVTRNSLETGMLSRDIATVFNPQTGLDELLVINELGNDLVRLSQISFGGFGAAAVPGTTTTPTEGEHGSGFGGMEPAFFVSSTTPLGKRPFAISVYQPVGQSPTIAVAAIGVGTDAGALYVIDDSGVREFPAGNGPIAVVVDDFNGDGQPDFITASFRDGKISARLSGVNEPIEIAEGLVPRSISKADINGDSHLDLVVVTTGFSGDSSSEVIVLLGDGKGGFTALRDSVSRGGAIDVVVGDYNGSGSDEIIIANFAGSVEIFGVDTTTGTLSRQAFLSVDPGITAVAAEDINGDGILDLVTVNPSTESIEIFIGQVDGSFVKNRTIRGVVTPAALAIGNFDGDSIRDIAVANLFSSSAPYRLPSTVTILGLTVTEREVTLSQTQSTTADFGFMQFPSTPLRPLLPSEFRPDINRDGIVNPLDALLVLNEIGVQRRGIGEGETVRRAGPRYKFDVNGDGVVTPLDALLILNRIASDRRAMLLGAEGFDDAEDRVSVIDQVMAEALLF